MISIPVQGHDIVIHGVSYEAVYEDKSLTLYRAVIMASILNQHSRYTKSTMKFIITIMQPKIINA